MTQGRGSEQFDASNGTAKEYSFKVSLTLHPFKITKASLVTVFTLILWSVSRVFAADFEEAKVAFEKGEYEKCVELTRAEVERGIWSDVWARKLIETLLVLGKYDEATKVYEAVGEKFSSSLSLRILGAKAYRFAGEAEIGDRLLNEIPDLVSNAPWRYNGNDNQLAKGRFLLSRGEDARDILKLFYDRALQANPKFTDAYIAIGELALEKADFGEASKSLTKALELRPSDPQISYLLAKAWGPSDSEKAGQYLEGALKLNPNHAESLLLEAGKLIDAERYEESESVLAEVLRVNPSHPMAWAYRAAIAHLRGEYRQEGKCRVKALSTWQLNPEVDYLIGKTLSNHYRFREGVQYQRRALKLDPKFAPARFQLAQDLLRVGEDAEGWSIIDQISDADPYNVVAYNLQTLQGRLGKFSILEVPGFIIRMEPREAKIYGPRVVTLLQEARHVLTAKYDVELESPITVEIFPRQSDFAIRTFGLPGGAGFLGVCFGNLITANSPASQGESPSNWESVLWHEFCHVVTLHKTKNRMPRWLSEGISVYEELEQNARWGQRMNPQYKAMILGEDFVPLSELSSAFMSPKSGLHLQFAYYESSLAVRYLIERHGLPLMLRLLDDLGMGVTMAEALERRFGQKEALDADFEKYVIELAATFLPETDFESDGFPKNATAEQLDEWEAEHPNSYIAQTIRVREALGQGRLDEAKKAAVELVDLYPDNADPGGGLDLMLKIAQKMQDEVEEQKALERLLEHSSDNISALTRMVELMAAQGDWRSAKDYSKRLLAVQPLVVTGHEALAAAGAELDEPEVAIPALRALKEMEPIDPAGLQFELAEMLYAAGDLRAAKIEVLLALEFAPRFREALSLLLKIRRGLDGKLEGNAKAEVESAAVGKVSIEVKRPLDGLAPIPKNENASEQ